MWQSDSAVHGDEPEASQKPQGQTPVTEDTPKNVEIPIDRGTDPKDHYTLLKQEFSF
ncbi:MAG: hypothetical protein J4432_05115 [DPANN group archaeon]|nr:hypothetical protein [DPANN group archaeon]